MKQEYEAKLEEQRVRKQKIVTQEQVRLMKEQLDSLRKKGSQILLEH